MVALLLAIGLASCTKEINAIHGAAELTTVLEIKEAWCLPSGSVAFVTASGFLSYKLAAPSQHVSDTFPQGRVFHATTNVEMGVAGSGSHPMRIPEREWGGAFGPFVSPDLAMMIARPDRAAVPVLFTGVDTDNPESHDLPAWSRNLRSAIWTDPRTAVLDLFDSVAIVAFAESGTAVPVVSIAVPTLFVAADETGAAWVLSSSGDSYQVSRLSATVGATVLVTGATLPDLDSYVADFKVVDSRPMALLGDGRIVVWSSDGARVVSPPLDEGQVARRFCVVGGAGVDTAAIVATEGARKLLFRRVLTR